MSVRDHSDEFETQVVLCCIVNEVFRNYVLGTIQPEYFSNVNYQYIYQRISLMNVNKQYISFISLSENIKLDFSLSDDKVTEYLSIVSKLSEIDKQYYDTMFNNVKASIEEYITGIRIKMMLGDGFQAWKSREYQKCLNIARDLEHQCRLVEKKTTSFWENTNMLLNSANEIWEPGIPMFVSGKDPIGNDITVDACLHFNGIRRGQLALLQAAPNVGKTTMLVNVAMAQMFAGYRVAFYTLEVDTAYLNTRAYSLLCGFSINDIKNIDHNALYSRLQNELQSRQNIQDIIWFENPTRSISPSQIHLDIKALQSKGQKPDVVIIDYLDLLAPDRYYKDQRRLEIQDITIDLRRIAGETGVSFIAATQSNREAIKKGSDMSNIGEDFSKAQTTDYLFALNRQENKVTDKGKPKIQYTWSLKVEKNRFGKVGQVIHLVDADMNKSRFFKVV